MQPLNETNASASFQERVLVMRLTRKSALSLLVFAFLCFFATPLSAGTVLLSDNFNSANGGVGDIGLRRVQQVVGFVWNG